MRRSNVVMNAGDLYKRNRNTRVTNGHCFKGRSMNVGHGPWQGTQCSTVERLNAK